MSCSAFVAVAAFPVQLAAVVAESALPAKLALILVGSLMVTSADPLNDVLGPEFVSSLSLIFKFLAVDKIFALVAAPTLTFANDVSPVPPRFTGKVPTFALLTSIPVVATVMFADPSNSVAAPTTAPLILIVLGVVNLAAEATLLELSLVLSTLPKPKFIGAMLTLP